MTIFQAVAAPTSGSGNTSSSSSSVTSSGVISSSGTQSPPASSLPATKKGGISSGALAAAIAVPIVVIALLAIGYGIFAYRKRKAAKTTAGAGQPESWGKSELHGEHVPPTELPMTERFELHGEGIHNEVVGDEPPVHEIGTISPR